MAPDEENGWKFDIDSLEAKIKPNTNWLFAIFHTIQLVISLQGDFIKILEIAKKHGIYVFSDECIDF